VKKNKKTTRIIFAIFFLGLFVTSCGMSGKLPLETSTNSNFVYHPIIYRQDNSYVPPVYSAFEIRNVKDFGAKGDGISDDILSINMAINNLPKTGGVVYFPPGIYAVSKTLVVSGNGVTIEGAGIGRLGYMWGSPPIMEGATVIKWIGNGNGVLLKIGDSITPNAGCSVKNLVLDGNSLAKNLIVADATYYLNVENIAGYSWQNGFAITIKHSQNVYGSGDKYQSWSKLTFVNPYRNASGIDISPEGSLNVNQISISDCNISRSNIDNPEYTSLRLGYVDHSSFYRCVFMPSTSAHDWSEAGGQTIRKNPYAITIQPIKDYSIFPMNISFFGTSIYGGINYITTIPWSEKYYPALIFYPFYSADFQIIPPNGFVNGVLGRLPSHMVSGFTDRGTPLK